MRSLASAPSTQLVSKAMPTCGDRLACTRSQVLSARQHPKDAPSNGSRTASRSSSPTDAVAVDMDAPPGRSPRRSRLPGERDLTAELGQDEPLLAPHIVTSDADVYSAADRAGRGRLGGLPDRHLASVELERGLSLQPPLHMHDKHRSGTAPTVAKHKSRASGKAAPARGCCNCLPGPTGWRRRLHTIVNTGWFGNGSIGLVLLNLVLMCMPYAGQTEDFAVQLENAATVISVLFMVRARAYTCMRS